MVGARARRASRARAHHQALARRVRSDTAIRRRSRHAVRRLFRSGGDDVLPDAGLEIPGAHLRPAHRLSRGQQHPAALRAGRGEEQAEEGLVRRLPRLRPRGLGAAWTKRRSARPSATAVGAEVHAPRDPGLLRRRRAHGGVAAARATARPRPLVIAGRHRARAALVAITARRRSR